MGSSHADHGRCSSLDHTWQYQPGNTVSNRAYNGVDYDIVSALLNIDYPDSHMYPTQGGDGTALMEYGQRPGFPDAVSDAGLRQQLQDSIKVGHANGKPVVSGEIGFPREVTSSNTHYPLKPRHNAFKDFFGVAGDGMLPWSATTKGSRSLMGMA